MEKELQRDPDTTQRFSRARDLNRASLRGFETYLHDEETPVPSSAARDLVERAMRYTPENPLYVIAIGAITNVASAILMNPLSASASSWYGSAATRSTGRTTANSTRAGRSRRTHPVRLRRTAVQLPCMGVVSSFTVSEPELRQYLLGKMGCAPPRSSMRSRKAAARPRAARGRASPDVTAVAWLLGEDFMADTLVHSPIPQYDHTWTPSATRHFIRYVYAIHRDRLLADLVPKLTGVIFGTHFSIKCVRFFHLYMV